MPSALSESQGPIHWCDNRCSENAVRYWHFASVVVDDAHIINLRQQCYNEQMVHQGKPRLKSWHWRAVAERKTHRGRIWKAMENEQFIQGMWEVFYSQRCRSKKRFSKMLRGNSKMGYKVSGNSSPPSERFWNKSEDTPMWDVAPK